jgi:ribosomal protein S18 acetylase RimI-like enzyme
VIEAIALHDASRAYATLVSAFVDDPVERWMYPELDDYEAHFPKFLAALGAAAFEAGTAWHLSFFAVVGLWLPPGAEPDADLIVTVLRNTVEPAKQRDVFAVLQAMDSRHPGYDHWYLPWLGVHPSLQGRGLGGRLLSETLGKVDDTHLPAYLESPNPRNVSLYTRHGFETVATIEIGECPLMTCMLRQAR